MLKDVSEHIMYQLIRYVTKPINEILIHMILWFLKNFMFWICFWHIRCKSWLNDITENRIKSNFIIVFIATTSTNCFPVFLVSSECSNLLVSSFDLNFSNSIVLTLSLNIDISIRALCIGIKSSSFCDIWLIVLNLSSSESESFWVSYSVGSKRFIMRIDDGFSHKLLNFFIFNSDKFFFFHFLGNCGFGIFWVDCILQILFLNWL